MWFVRIMRRGQDNSSRSYASSSSRGCSGYCEAVATTRPRPFGMTSIGADLARFLCSGAGAIGGVETWP